MIQKLIQVLSISVVIAALSAPLALAGTEYVYGQVKSVDAEKGTLVIVTDEGDTKTLSVPKKMLKDVKPGHEVDVEIVEGKVKDLANYSAQG